MNGRINYSYGLPKALLALEFLLLAIIAAIFDFSVEVEEVSLIEYTQVAVLLAACALSVWAYLKAAIPLNARQWFLVLACLLLFAAARELNFGRVLYLVAGQPVSGDVFQSYRHKWPCMLIRGTAYTIGSFGIIYMLWRKLLFSLPSLLQQTQIYSWDVILLFVFVVLCHVGEMGLHNGNMEEFCELVVYALAFNFCWRYAKVQGIWE